MVSIFVVKKKNRLDENVEEVFAVTSTRDRAIQAIQRELLSIYAEWRYAQFTIEYWQLDWKCMHIEVLTQEENKQLIIKGGGTPE